MYYPAQKSEVPMPTNLEPLEHSQVSSTTSG